MQQSSDTDCSPHLAHAAAAPGPGPVQGYNDQGKMLVTAVLQCAKSANIINATGTVLHYY